MIPIRLERRIPVPQASPTSIPTSASQSSTRSSSSGSSTSIGSSSASPSTSASWDTRAGIPVFSSTPPRPSSSPTNEHHSNGFLSSKIGVAALCASIAVACLLLAGLLVYKVQARKIRKRQMQASGTPSLAPSNGPPSTKVPPSPFQLKSRPRHPQEEILSRTSSTRRSQNPSTASRTALSEGGQASQYFEHSAEALPMQYQHTSTTISRSATSQSRSPFHRESVSQSVGSSASNMGVSVGGPTSREDNVSPFPLQRDNSIQSRTFFDRHSLVTAASSRTSMPESTLNNSRTHLLLPTSSATPIVPVSTGSSGSTLRDGRPLPRPLPAPPHPPPAYEAINNLRHPLSPIPAMSTSTLNVSLIPGDKKDPLPSADNVVSHSTGLSSVSSQPRQEYPYVFDPVTRVLISSSSGPVADTTLPPSGDTAPEGLPQTVLSAGSEPPPFSAPSHSAAFVPNATINTDTNTDHPEAQDPFAHPQDDLPAWLYTDPFPVGHSLRHHASQHSLYGGPARSVAASSHVLPSPTNSARSLSPEPTEFVRVTSGTRASASSVSLAHALLRRPPTAATSLRPPSVSASMVSSARTQIVEGEGPALEDVVINPGAERPGWAQSGTHLSASSSLSRNRRKMLPDHFDELEVHPRRSAELVGSGSGSHNSTLLMSPNSAVQQQQELQPSSTFLSMTPLSEAIPGPGLSRAFSIDSPRKDEGNGRGRNSNSNDNVINGLLRGRTITAFRTTLSMRASRLPTSMATTTTTTTMPPVVGSVTRNHSISHAGTIRHSSHGDVGWLDPASAVAAAAATTGSSASGGGRVSTAVSSSRPQPSEADSIRSMSPEVGWIEEEERGNTVGEMGEAKRVSVMGKRRASRLSMNEGAILWGKLTSQLEEDARTRP